MTPDDAREALRTRVAAVREAAARLAQASDAQRRLCLEQLARQLRLQAGPILAANAEDVARAAGAGMAPALLDRLRLDPGRLEGIAADVGRVAALPDPLAGTLEERRLANGLRVRRVPVPLGVLAVIYEARPNVTVDSAALAIRSGNAAVLRGSRDTRASNRALHRVVQEALVEAGLDPAAVLLLDGDSRDEVEALLAQDDLIDLAIPRGGQALQQHCRKVSRVPVVTGGIGICHLYFAESADLARALPVIENAKVQRPTVCNALDTLLVHESRVAEAVPALLARLSPLGVRCLAGPGLQALLPGQGGLDAAGPGDFDAEWLSLTLGIEAVASLEAALAHIRRHGSGHSDGILTADPAEAAAFQRGVDSAVVYWNASTRFTDGGALGLGAEIAVSTQRVHARGPMGLRELTGYKWLVDGDYHARG